MKTALLCTLLAATSAAAAEGTAPRDLKGFLQAADEYNLDHRISLETRERAIWEFHQAWTGLLPAVTVSGTWTRNPEAIPLSFAVPLGGQPGPSNTLLVPSQLQADGRTSLTTFYQIEAELLAKNQLDGFFRIDLPLIDTARWMRTAAAGASKLGAVERELVMRDLVRRQVVAAYYGYAATLAVLESSKKSLGVAEAQLKLMDIRAKAGSVTELELLRASAEVQRNRQVVTDTVATVATSRRTLRTLSGVEPPEVVPLPETDTRPEPGFVELEAQVEGLPSVKAADRDADAASTLAWSARLALIPTVSGQFTGRATNAAGLTGQTETWSTGATLTWRLDGPTLMGYGVQDHAEATARLAADKSRLTAKDQIHSDWQRFNAGLQKVTAAEAQVQAATKAEQVARERYQVGAATQVDVIQAERDLFQAEVGQIQARTELATARASLRISAGRPPLD